MKKYFFTLIILSFAFLSFDSVKSYTHAPTYNKIQRYTIDCVIMMGQSNMEGGTNSPAPSATYLGTQPNTLTFFKNDDITTTDNGALQTYLFPFNSDYRADVRTYIGPDISIGHKYYELTGKKLVIIKYSLGGSALVDDGVTTTAAGIWQVKANSARANGLRHYYIALGSFIKPCIKQCKAKGIDLNIKAVFWCQGETDAGTNLYRAENYEAKLTELLDSLKMELTPYNVLSPGYKPIITRIHNRFNPARPYQNEVRTAQVNVANNLGGSWINSDAYGLHSDSIHFNYLGSQQHGIDAATILSSY